jgi:hypothetical protein
MAIVRVSFEGQDQRDPIKQVEAPLSDKQEKLGIREVISCLQKGDRVPNGLMRLP